MQCGIGTTSRVVGGSCNAISSGKTNNHVLQGEVACKQEQEYRSGYNVCVREYAWV